MTFSFLDAKGSAVTITVGTKAGYSNSAETVYLSSAACYKFLIKESSISLRRFIGHYNKFLEATKNSSLVHSRTDLSFGTGRGAHILKSSDKGILQLEGFTKLTENLNSSYSFVYFNRKVTVCPIKLKNFKQACNAAFK